MWDADRRILSQDDSRAITTIIGAIFVFSFIIILLSINQAQVVPQQNSEVEFQHFQDVRSDMVGVQTDILSAARTDTVRYTTVRLGTTYPSRVVAMNPPPPTGTLRTTEEHNIIIQGKNTKEIGTRFLEYQPGYNELDAGVIRYENSVLYLDQRGGSGGVAIIEEQNIVANNSNKTRIPVLKKEYSESSAGRVAIEIQPVGEDTKTVGVVPNDQGNVSISIPTRLSEDYWNRSDVPVAGFVSSSDGINYVNITRSIDSVEFNTVGADSAPDGIDIEEEFKGVRPVENAPGGPFAYRDSNNNLNYDSGETKYSEDELYDFDKNVNLVIPPDVGTPDDPIENSKVSIEADNITSRADFETDSGGITLDTSNNGVIDVANSTLDSSSEKTEIAKSSQAILVQTNISSPGLDVTASNVSAADANISTDNDGVTLEKIEGEVDLTDSNISSSSQKTKISQKSSGAEVGLDDANVSSPGLDVTASNVSAADANISTDNDGVTLEKIEGEVDLTDSNISSSSQKTEISQKSSDAEVTLDDANVSSPGLDVTTSNVSAADANLSTTSNGVTLKEIEGEVNLTDSNISSSSQKTEISQKSSGAEVTLDDANVSSPGLDITTSNVSAVGANISTDNDGVTLEKIEGEVNLTDSNISSSSQKTEISQKSSGAEVTLDDANVSSPGLDITTSNVSAVGANVSTDNDGVTLEKIEGEVDLTDSNISSTSETTKILQTSSDAEAILKSAEITSEGLDAEVGNIDATDANITTTSDGISLESEKDDIRLKGADLITTSSGVTVDADGAIPAAAIQIDSSGEIQLSADGDINIKDDTRASEIFASGSASAEFDNGSYEFTVTGVIIETDNNNNMTYSPPGVTVDGEADQGNVTSSSG